ncbi:MAG: hypothetical protein ACPGSC_08920 [Granulosicoccaceae bacterium]
MNSRKIAQLNRASKLTRGLHLVLLMVFSTMAYSANAGLPENVWVSVYGGSEGTTSIELTWRDQRGSAAQPDTWLGSLGPIGNSWRFGYSSVDTGSWCEGCWGPMYHFDEETGRKIDPLYQTLSISRGYTKSLGYGVVSAYAGLVLLHGYGYSSGCEYLSDPTVEHPVGRECQYQKSTLGGSFVQVDVTLGAYVGLGFFLRHSSFQSPIRNETDIGLQFSFGRFHQNRSSN